MTNKLKNKMELYWNENSTELPKEETEKLITLNDYLDYAQQVLDGTIVVFNTNGESKTIDELLEEVVNEAEELAKTIIEYRKWDDSYFNSVMDRLVVNGCIVEGEYFTEQDLYTSLVSDDKIELTKHEKELATSTHKQVEEKRAKTTAKLDRAIDAPKQERSIYLASVGLDRK